MSSMKVYFDESGNFIKNDKIDDTFVCALIIPEAYEQRINNEFVKIKEAIRPGTVEVKGSQLDITDRINFCEWLEAHKGEIRIKCNCLLERDTNHSGLAAHRAKAANNISVINQQYAQILGEDHKKIQFLKKFEGLIRHNTRLPDLDYYHVGLYNDAIRGALQFSVAYFMDEKHKENFYEYHFIFDGKLTRKLAPCEKLIQEYLTYLWDNRARTRHSNPLGIPDFWKDINHPFCRSFFDEEKNLSLNRIFKNGFNFPDSRDSLGLQLVDIIVNTVYKHFKDPNDKSIRICYNMLETHFGFEKKGKGAAAGITSIKLF